MNLRKQQILAVFLTLCMSATPTMAATVSDAVINPEEKGSLTIHKYDTTAAALDQITFSPDATGRVDSALEQTYSGYEVDGVAFTYLKVADITTYTESQTTGESKVQVAYAMEENDALLTCLGLDRNDSITEIQDPEAGIFYFSSDTLIDALADLETTDLNLAKNQLENYVSDNGGTTMALTGTAGNSKGVTSADNLELGLYLVVETQVPQQVTDTVKPFFVSLPMTDNDGDSWNYDVVVYPKNESGMPTLEKLTAEKTNAALPGDLAAASHKENDAAYAPTATASDGDLVWYQITSKLPVIHSEATYLTDYTFVDTLGAGIAYEEEDVTLCWYTDAACTNRAAEWDLDSGKYQVNYGKDALGDSTMTISMTGTGLQEINTAGDEDASTNYGEYYLRISYSARVQSSDAVVYGEEGNPNRVLLTWKRTSMDYYDTLSDECLVYTFAMDVTKQFADQKGDFDQVSFKIQNETDGFYLLAEEDPAKKGVYYLRGEAGKNTDEASATIFVPNPEDGTLKIYGVEDDAYRITELTTDDGYTLLKDSVLVEIATETEKVIYQQKAETSADGHISGVAYDDYLQTSENEIRKASAKVDGNTVVMTESEGSLHAMVPMTIVNSRSFEIPQTGDSGNFLLPVIGMTAAALLTVGFLVKRKEEDEAV